MAKRLTTTGRTFVPNMTFPDDETDSGLVQNRDLGLDEQVSCEIKLATIGQKTEYLGSYTVGGKHEMLTGGVKQFTVLQYEKCVRKHVGKISGLEEFGIKNGRELVAHEPTPELNDIIQECFFKVNGIHGDDNQMNSDGGDLTTGESKASE